MKEFDLIKDSLMDRANIKVSKTLITGIGTKVFTKLRQAVSTPKTIWAKYLKKPHYAYPLLKLVWREETLIAASSITSIIKSSEEFANTVEIYL